MEAGHGSQGKRQHHLGRQGPASFCPEKVLIGACCGVKDGLEVPAAPAIYPEKAESHRENFAQRCEAQRHEVHALVGLFVPLFGMA